MHHYRALQNWNRWLAHTEGQRLMSAEKKALSHLLKKHLGRYALLIGVPQQNALLQSTNIIRHALITPINDHHFNEYTIESHFYELPIQTGAVDLVLLTHAHEFVDNPQQLFLEACRIIKPEGLIVICGFNPYHFRHFKTFKEAGQFIAAHDIKRWPELADFVLEEKHYVTGRKFHFLPFMGEIYILLARAKVIP